MIEISEDAYVKRGRILLQPRALGDEKSTLALRIFCRWDIPIIEGNAREKMIVSSPRVLPSSATLIIECWIVDLLICLKPLSRDWTVRTAKWIQPTAKKYKNSSS